MSTPTLVSRIFHPKRLRRLTAPQSTALEVTHEFEDTDDLSAGEPITLKVQLEREVDEDEEVNTTVVAPFFPQKHNEQWCVFSASLPFFCTC